MPNVRIGRVTLSWTSYDDRRSLTARSRGTFSRTQSPFARGATRFGRSRSTAAGRGHRRDIPAEGVSRPERPRADPIRRLGKQGHRLGFLSPNTAFARDQRVTTTVVPIETRSYRSVMSGL